tara:strand:+ start:2078 stop:2596 length:519 start_codon:yes stop_codon:yes gene_type:complete
MDYLSTEIRSAREVSTIFKILGIKDITTKRQHKNGTKEYELPIKKMYSTGTTYSMKFATYETGYIRNTSDYLSCCYQINKTKEVVKDVDWSNSPVRTNERILIPNWEDRLIYLCKFILKNYYQRSLFTMCNYNRERLQEVSKEYHQMRWEKQEHNDVREVQVIVDGHRYSIC